MNDVKIQTLHKNVPQVNRRRKKRHSLKVAGSALSKQSKLCKLCFPLRTVCLFRLFRNENTENLIIYFVLAEQKSVNEDVSLLIKT